MSFSAPTETGRRFKFVNIPLSPRQQRKLYRAHVEEAARWIPPKTRTEMVELEKGTPEYEKSFLVETLTWYSPGL